MEEIWKDISGYEGLYQVSNLGRAMFLHYYSKSKSGGRIVIKDNSSLSKNCRGYYCIKSNKKDERVDIAIHRAVARAFPEICGEWFEGCVVHHIDGNKENNAATNLMVITEEEHQAIHSNDGVTYKNVSTKLKGHKKTEEHIRKIMESRRSYDGEGNPFFGKTHSEETKIKLKNANLGKHPSETTRKKMSDNSSNKKPVIAVKDGCVVKEFASIKEGADYFGLHPQNINQVLKGRGKRCGGYEWKYVS